MVVLLDDIFVRGNHSAYIQDWKLHPIHICIETHNHYNSETVCEAEQY
jgi:hypothetical protein